MKRLAAVILIAFLLSSCDTTRQLGNPISQTESNGDTLIIQSLFNDKASTISEEGIQKILDGTYKLPRQLRVAIVRLDNNQQRRYWNDEDYLKTQQSYLDLFGNKFKQSQRVTRVSIIPDLLISKTPSFTSIREAAVRLQADIVVVYSTSGDIYSKYKLFTKTDIKAFATTQLIILDVRTGLVPFSTIVTKDIVSQKKKEELDNSEAKNRIQNEAVLSTINEIVEQIASFLNEK
jgi:predicted small secreted protein